MPRKMTREEYNSYMKQYMLSRWHERRNGAIDFMGGVCYTPGCGGVDWLQFDHVNPKWKRYNISSVPAAAEHRFWTEIMACQLLCGPCHRAKTSAEQSVPHGGGKTGKKNCYCELCAPLKRAWQKERRSRNKAGMV